MKTVIISVQTVTNAIKARKHLSARGIKANIIKLNPSYSINGCTHGIEINHSDTYSAVSILKEIGINYKIFTERK